MAQITNKRFTLLNNSGTAVLRLGYDASNFTDFTPDSSGNLTMDKGLTVQSQFEVTGDTGATTTGMKLTGTRPTFRLEETDGNANENWQIRTEAGELLFQTNNDAFTSASTILTINQAGTGVWKAGTTAAASIRIPHGSAPTSPTNGDMWTTTSGLFVRINGTTVGPLS